MYQQNVFYLLACQHISCSFCLSAKGCSCLSGPWEVLRGDQNMEVRNQNLETSWLGKFATGSPVKNSNRYHLSRTQKFEFAVVRAHCSSVQFKVCNCMCHERWFTIQKWWSIIFNKESAWRGISTKYLFNNWFWQCQDWMHFTTNGGNTTSQPNRNSNKSFEIIMFVFFLRNGLLSFIQYRWSRRP